MKYDIGSIEWEIDRLHEEIKRLRKHNTKLMEHIIYLKKNGYTYDQITTKMVLCDRCGDLLRKEND